MRLSIRHIASGDKSLNRNAYIGDGWENDDVSG